MVFVGIVGRIKQSFDLSDRDCTMYHGFGFVVGILCNVVFLQPGLDQDRGILRWSYDFIDILLTQVLAVSFMFRVRDLEQVLFDEARVLLRQANLKMQGIPL